MNYNREWIAGRIPHQGSMCLLDHVVSWSETQAICLASSHLSADNPLRAHSRLGAAIGIEYAAQAMAIHGALLAQNAGADRPRAGYLASVRSVSLHVERLDDVKENLRIEVVRIYSEGNSILYQFSICGNHTSTSLLEGRAAVILDVAGLTKGKQS